MKKFTKHNLYLAFEHYSNKALARVCNDNNRIACPIASGRCPMYEDCSKVKAKDWEKVFSEKENIVSEKEDHFTKIRGLCTELRRALVKADEAGEHYRVVFMNYDNRKVSITSEME